MACSGHILEKSCDLITSTGVCRKPPQELGQRTLSGHRGWTSGGSSGQVKASPPTGVCNLIVSLYVQEAATGVGQDPGEPYLGTKAELLAAAANVPALLIAALFEQANANPPSPK